MQPHERQTRQFGMPQDNIRVQRAPPKRIRGHLGLPREPVSLPRDSATRIATSFDCRGTTQTPGGTTWTTRATTPATFASLKSQYHGLRPLTGNCYLTLT